VARRIKVNWIRILLKTVLCLLALSPFALSRQAKPKADSGQNGTKDAKQQSASEGEKRFRANCGRCHNAPQEISPREARAVVRQMRVRAMLSSEDEKLILQYLAP
jgi:hypothetical protein